MLWTTCVVCGEGIATNNPHKDMHARCEEKLVALQEELAREAVEQSDAFEKAASPPPGKEKEVIANI